jgi:hypothetical protein
LTHYLLYFTTTPASPTRTVATYDAAA